MKKNSQDKLQHQWRKKVKPFIIYFYSVQTGWPLASKLTSARASVFIFDDLNVLRVLFSRSRCTSRTRYSLLFQWWFRAWNMQEQKKLAQHAISIYYYLCKIARYILYLEIVYYISLFRGYLLSPGIFFGSLVLKNQWPVYLTPAL